MNQPVSRSFQHLFDPHRFTFKNGYTRTVFSKIFSCRTSRMGFHLYECNNPDCGHHHMQYHSCGDRHCCFCGAMKKEEWVERRMDDLLPCPYYHIVFTVPNDWHRVILQAPKEMYKLLFDAAWQTLQTLGKDAKLMGATPGVTAVLHTWGQTLNYHPHLHCIVSGGGINNHQWVAPKRVNGKFLFPVEMIRKVYKGIFLRLARERKINIPVESKQIDEAIRSSIEKKWKVYAKKPFGGPEQVIRYLGRYTHKTAITPQRIQSVDEQTLRFAYRDYRDDKSKEMTLTHQEFLLRFERHILPNRFVRIRHYGLLQNHGKVKRIRQLRQQMDWKVVPVKIEVPMTVRVLEKYGVDLTRCSQCDKGRYQLILTKRCGKIIYHKPRDVPLEVRG